MILRFNQEDKFAPRLVWLEDSEKRFEAFESAEDKSKTTFEQVRSPEKADEVCSAHEEDILKKIKDRRDASAGRTQQFLENLADKKVSLDKSVHEIHEEKALAKLDEQYNGAMAKVRNIRTGRVNRWKAPEVALATSKLKELSETRKSLDASIREANARANKYKALLEQWRQSKTGFLTKRISNREFKNLIKREPDQVDDLKEAKGSVQKIETETRSSISAYDAQFRAKYAGYMSDERKFKDYFFSVPAFLHDDELRSKFDEILAEDQTNGNLSESIVMKRINDSSLTDEQKEVMRTLYSKMVQGVDMKMRELIQARNAKERVDEVDFELLQKLEPGQDITIGHSVLSSLGSKHNKTNRKTETVSQHAYVTSKPGDPVITLRVSDYDVAKLGEITKTVQESGELKAREFSYKPKKQTIKIDTRTGEITNEFEATDTSKNGKNKPVKLTDSYRYELDEKNKFKKIRISGDIPKKTLT